MKALTGLVILVGIHLAPEKAVAAACQKAMNVRTLAQELYDVSAYSQLAPYSMRLSWFARYLQNIARPEVPCKKIERAFQHVKTSWADLDRDLERKEEDLEKDRKRLRRVYQRLKAAVSAKDVYSSLFFETSDPSGQQGG